MSRRRGSPRELAARALALGLLGRLRDGAVIVHEGGRRQLCGRPVAGERVPEVEVRSPETWRAAATEGSAGLGRAYFEGWWSADSLDELATFLRVLLRNRSAIESTGALARLGAPVRRLLWRDSARPPEQGRLGLRSHAELGPELFGLFLDESLSYSAALFPRPTASLGEAQVAKVDRLCRKLVLGPADHVLEVGTGWGSFALHAASRYGCRVTIATGSALVQEQAAARAKAAGLEDLVTVIEREIGEVTGSYDKVVSIEAAEALDWRFFDALFSRCGELLAPDGLLALQAVVVADQEFERARRSDDFVKRYVLPGASLPSVATILSSAARTSDLRLCSLEDIGPHAAETVRRWRSAFAEHRDGLQELGLDDTFARLFEFYLCYCEAAFAERYLGDVQCVLARSRWRPGGLGLPFD